MTSVSRFFSLADMKKLGVDLKPGALSRSASLAWSDIRAGRAYGLKSVLCPNEVDLSANRELEALRQNLSGERLGWKLSALSSVGADYAAVKIVGANALNRRLGLPRSASTILLLDKFSLRPLCVMDGTEISAARTATYVSTIIDLLFRDKAGMSVFVFGAGPIAQWIVKMLGSVGNETVSKVFVRSRTGESARQLVIRHAPELAFPILAVSDNSRLRECEFVITATNSSYPVYEACELGTNTAVLHLAGDESPKDYVQTVLRNGLAICDDVTLVSRRNSQSLALYFSRNATTLEVVGPLLGVLNMKDIAPVSLAGPDRPTLVTCVGLPMLDLYVAAYVYDTWLKDSAKPRATVRA